MAHPDQVRKARAAKIEEVFRQWDSDGNGFISKVELQAVILKLLPPGESLTKADIDRLMVEADRNGNGRIEYHEFAEWLTRPGASMSAENSGVALFDLPKLLGPLFQVYDRNGDGSISFEEFQECQNILQTALSLHPGDGAARKDPSVVAASSKRVFQEVDIDNNRTVSFEEFVNWQRKALQKSGLLNDDLQDLIPALTRQLQRVFKLSESNEKGQLTNADQNVLMHITKNLANFSRDIYNDAEAGHSSLRGRHHYKNRWTEPPVGLNLDRLKGLHLKLATVPTWGVEDLNLSVLCVPEVDTRDARHRRWIARIVRQVTYKTGRQEIDEPQYYVYEALNWTSNEDLAPEFDQCLACLPPELRLFCLLKAEANFGVQIGWNSVQVALKRAVQMGLLTAEQQTLYTRHTDSIVMRTLRERSMSKPSAGEVERLRSQTTCAPRHVMAALSELGILKVSSVWADVLKA